MRKTRRHILIIGAGISGLSTAFALRQQDRNLRLTLIESGPEAGHGASWANGSMIHPSQSWPWSESRAEAEHSVEIALRSFELALRSSKILSQHFKAFGLAQRHLKTGTAKIFSSPEALDHEIVKLEPMKALGLEYQLWTVNQLEAKFDLNLSSQTIEAALYFPQDHSGPARIYCQKLIEQLRGKARIVKNKSVVAIDQKGVWLSDETYINADDTIVCAGAGATNLLPELNIFPLRGYSRTFHMGDLDLKGEAVALPAFALMDDAAHISITPLGDHLRISGGADAPEHIDYDLYDYFKDYAGHLFYQLKPYIDKAPYSDWTALRPMRAKGPFIGHVKDNIWANTGHGHMGWTLSAGAADALARLICPA